MRVLVYPHSLSLGGSQLNAVELAGAVRDLGHEVIVYGSAGPLVSRLADAGIRFVEAPAPRRRPDHHVIRDLRRLIRRDHVDIVHGYEWPPILEARLACLGTPAIAVGTVMSMAVAPFLPRTVPLVVGTRQIAAHERRRGRREVTVIEPPVDTVRNSPEAITDADERRRVVSGGALHVVVVSRLVDALKGEGLATAISVVPRIAPGAVLSVVGDGPRRADFEAAAQAVNRDLGRRAVVMTGPLEDPRPAYASADIVLGMGGSALRGMAFGKPLVVQGENGFWEVLTPQTLPQFRWTGWYGVGDGRGDGSDRLRAALAPLVADPALRRDLGQFARRTVESYFSLDEAARAQERVYESAVLRCRQRIPRRDDAAGAARFLHFKGAEWRDRLRHRSSTEDFNALPVSSEGAASGAELLVVYRSPNRWEDRDHDDECLMEAAAGRFRVLWVDPPCTPRHADGHGSHGTLRAIEGLGWRVEFGDGSRALDRVIDGLGVTRRVEVVALPGARVGSLAVDGTVLVLSSPHHPVSPLADVTLVRDEVALRRLGGPSVRVRRLPEGPSDLAAVIEEVARP